MVGGRSSLACLCGFCKAALRFRLASQVPPATRSPPPTATSASCAYDALHPYNLCCNLRILMEAAKVHLDSSSLPVINHKVVAGPAGRTELAQAGVLGITDSSGSSRLQTLLGAEGAARRLRQGASVYSRIQQPYSKAAVSETCVRVLLRRSTAEGISNDSRILVLCGNAQQRQSGTASRGPITSPPLRACAALESLAMKVTNSRSETSSWLADRRTCKQKGYLCEGLHKDS